MGCIIAKTTYTSHINQQPAFSSNALSALFSVVEVWLYPETDLFSNIHKCASQFKSLFCKLMPSVQIKLILKVNPELGLHGSLTLVEFGDAPGNILINAGFMAN